MALERVRRFVGKRRMKRSWNEVSEGPTIDDDEEQQLDAITVQNSPNMKIDGAFSWLVDQ